MTGRAIALGYLVPEFPGQTHNFFHREIRALTTLGIEVYTVSTRRPPRGVMSTSWSREAECATTYLFPLRASELPGVLATLACAGPLAWLRCARAIACADSVDVVARLRLAALVIMAAKLVRTAKGKGWRHLHVHSCADAANVALFARWLGGLPYSLTLHGALAIYGGNQRQKWRHAAFGIAITHRLLGELRSSLGATPARIEVAPMGVDLEVFRREETYLPYDGTGELRVFCCSRLNPGKGHRDLIEAVALLVRRGMAVRLEIGGEDDAGGSGHRLEIAAFIRERGLQASVSLLGAISEEQVRKRLASAHVFALASSEEALGVAIMEAMAMELPVVATRVGGVPELITHGEDGLLVQANDPESLCEAIRQVAVRPELAARLGRRARARVAAGFSSRRSAKVLADLLRGVG